MYKSLFHFKRGSILDGGEGGGGGGGRGYDYLLCEFHLVTFVCSALVEVVVACFFIGYFCPCCKSINLIFHYTLRPTV